MKLMVVGHARHGKDTVGELLRDRYGLKFTSSSMACAQNVMLPAFDKIGKHYLDADACYDDRHDHRAFWHDQITAFCEERGLASLSRLIFDSNDVYCGIRNDREFFATKNAGLFNFSIWVDRSMRLPEEPRTSMKMEKWMCDYVLDNNGTMKQLEDGLGALMVTLTCRLKRIYVRQY